MYFHNENFGKCEVLCLYKDIAIIVLEKNAEKYVVASGFEFYNKSWCRGYYCRTLKDAGEVFNSLLEDFYMVAFKI